MTADWAERVRKFRRVEPPKQARARGTIIGWFGSGRFALIEGIGHARVTSMLLVNTLAFFDRQAWRTWSVPTRDKGAFGVPLDDQAFVLPESGSHFLVGPATDWKRKNVDRYLRFLNGDASIGLFSKKDGVRIVRFSDGAVLRELPSYQYVDNLRVVWRTQEKGPLSWASLAGNDPPRTTKTSFDTDGSMLDDGRILSQLGKLFDLERDETIELLPRKQFPTLFRSRRLYRGADACISIDGNTLVGVVQDLKDEPRGIRIPIAPSIAPRDPRWIRTWWHPFADIVIVDRRVITPENEIVLELDANPVGWTHDGTGIFAQRDGYLELWS